MKECLPKLLASTINKLSKIKKKKIYKTEINMSTIFKPTSKISLTSSTKELHLKIGLKGLLTKIL